MTSERLRILRRIAGFALAGVFVYLVALFFCFPYDRVRELAIAVAATQGYDVEIASVGPALPLALSFEDVRVRSRVTTGDGKPARANFDSARASMLPMLFSGGSAFDLELHGLGGEISLSGEGPRKGKKEGKGEGKGRSEPQPFHYLVRARGISMASLPGAKESLNLALSGTLDLTLKLQSPSGRMADAEGELSFKCASCAVGDGKSAVKLGGGNPFLAAGITLPRVRLGDLVGRAAIRKGVAKLDGVQAKSPDAELTLDGEVTLRDPLAQSSINAYLRLKLGDPLLKAAPALAGVLQMAGGPGRRPDGFYGMRIGGSFSNVTTTFSTTSPLPGQGTFGASGVSTSPPARAPAAIPIAPAAGMAAPPLPPPPPAMSPPPSPPPQVTPSPASPPSPTSMPLPSSPTVPSTPNEPGSGAASAVPAAPVSRGTAAAPAAAFDGGPRPPRGGEGIQNVPVVGEPAGPGSSPLDGPIGPGASPPVGPGGITAVSDAGPLPGHVEGAPGADGSTVVP